MKSEPGENQAGENSTISQELKQDNYSNQGIKGVAIIENQALRTGDGDNIVTLTPSPVYETETVDVLPTVTVETITKVIEYDYFIKKLSFYDPEIGDYFPEIASVNCAVWNIETSSCDSTMANGLNFVDYYGKAVACPPGMATGQEFEVLLPKELAGLWTCMDRGYSVEGDWMDFLLKYPDMIWTGYNLNNFPWGNDVVIRIERE